MSKFRFFGSLGDKNHSKENSKSKDNPVVKSLTPVVASKPVDDLELTRQKSSDDIIGASRSDSVILNVMPCEKTLETSSCDLTAARKNSITKKPTTTESLSALKSHNWKSRIPAFTKDQKLKQLEKELATKDSTILHLREEISRLTERIDLLETFVREKTLSEQEKLKNRRLPNASNDANPNSFADVSASLVKHEKSEVECDFLIRSIVANELFAHHEPSQIKDMAECMYRMEVKNGDYLMTENDDGNKFYIVFSGIFDIFKNKVKQATLTSGDCLGESMILSKTSMKTNSMAATDDCVVWTLDRKTYKDIMLNSKIELQTEYAKLINQVSIFGNLPETLTMAIMGICQEIKFQKFEYIYRIGDLGTCFYIVKEGSVFVYKKVTHQSVESTLVKKIGRGSHFGENVLMMQRRYLEDARASEIGCTLLTIESDDFNDLLGFEELGADTPLIVSVNSPANKEEKKSPIQPNKTLNSKPAPATHHSGSKNKKIKVTHQPVVETEQDHNIKLEDLRSVCTVAHCSISQLEIAYMKNCQSNLFLLKQFKKKEIVDACLQEKIMAEKKMLLSCHSPFIVRLHRTFKDRKYLYMLLEGCSGGDLASLLHDSTYFPDFHAKFYVGCVIEALSFLHKHAIVFRSIKPESILIDDRGYAKVADLGNAKKVGTSKRTYSFTGKTEYVAPEQILNKGYDTSVDFWALGILIFELTSGHVPFKASDTMKTYNLILKGFDGMVYPQSISKNAVRLIKKLCRHCPTERVGYNKGTWTDVRKSRWFENFDWIKLSQKALEPPIKPNVLDRLEILNDLFVKDDEIPPDETSGWDKDF